MSQKNLTQRWTEEMSGEGLFDYFQRDPNINPPKVRELLKRYGSYRIIGLQVFRKPIQSYVSKALNMLSFGSLNQVMSQLGYDNLFHLGLKLTIKALDDSEVIELILDKREVIKLEAWSGGSDMQFLTIDLPRLLTLEELLNQTRNYMGAKYGAYDAATNNCQVFILSILKANNLGNQEIYDWILQDTETLFKRLPAWLSKFSLGVTDLASSANRLIEGKGSKYVKKQLLDDTLIKENPKLTAKQKLLLQVAKKSKLIS